ncbi:MAG: LysM peptidoglycan-binding domain-containing M23 family metallopeptidase, partial [Patescibacteria group bacterium]|nr:LysM peptidoglycan-binding domain-containing M23 family metallopeptidase [Patescibacteria group bacterium]
ILPVTGIRHVVKKGETLASIAKKYEGDLDEIANYNDLNTDASLATGDQVIIPDGVVAVAAAPKPTVSAGVSIPAPTPTATPASSAGFANPLPGSVKTQGVHGYNGVDLGGTPAGSPVLASAAGSVIVAKNGGWNGGYGSYVVVQHGNGVQTLYAHLSSVSVGVGQSVQPGTKLGGVGSTGRSTGTHLHFEVRGASNPFK